MPFFRMDLKNMRHSDDGNHVPLQVRTPMKQKQFLSGIPSVNQSCWNQTTNPSGKRTRSFASLPVSASVSASVSVEAAFALSIFLFAMVALLMPFRMMDRQRQVQASLESVNEKVSQYAYLQSMVKNGESLPFASLLPGRVESISTAGAGAGKESGDSSWKSEGILEFINGASGMGAALLAEQKFEHTGMEAINSSRSSLLEDSSNCILALDYRMKLPFSILRLSSVPLSASSTRRAWVGRSGITEGTGEEGEEDDEIVYIGRYSTRYHRSRSCHYLSNKLQTVNYSAVEALRNEGGGKYYPCAVCGKSAKPGMPVYIMASGARFHTDQNCSAIIAYVQAVRLSEVKGLGACSYCGGK